MLRIDRENALIPVDYEDPYLQLYHLLTQGAVLEHALMASYLYAALSLKPQWVEIQGTLGPDDYEERDPSGPRGTAGLFEKATFLDICIEEMQHLSIVNALMAQLGMAPDFSPRVWPYSADIFPFDIQLLSLERYSAATYMWIESDECALSLAPKCSGKGETPAFIREVREVLKAGSEKYRTTPIDEERLNHLGSLYRAVIDTLRQVEKDPPPFIPSDFGWSRAEEQLHWLVYQGEIEHFRFFRDLYSGEAFGKDGSIWAPGNPDFPAYDLLRGTAYTMHEDTIPNEDARRVAWLSNLHYWIILALLDLAYRNLYDRKFRYKAIDNMTRGLWLLGLNLAQEYQVGLPFDPMGSFYGLGRNEAMTRAILERLVLEGRNQAVALQRDDLLPPGYSLELFDLTLGGLLDASHAVS